MSVLLLGGVSLGSSTMMSTEAEAAATWSTRTSTTGRARVYEPEGSSPIGEGRALLVALHGCTQTADDLEQLGNFEEVAEQWGLVVALPDVPGGGVIAGCWDYYGSLHTRTNRHNGFLLGLTEDLIHDPSLQVDPNQVYLAGLSSGAGQALIASCLAPELYAGVGVVQGPAVGTEASEIGFVSTTVEDAADVCRTLAGDRFARFADQLAVVYTSSNDYIVNQDYADLNAGMYAGLYADEPMISTDMDYAALPGYEPSGEVTIFEDQDQARVALLFADGAGHAWPAGSGPGPELSYVASEGVNFSAFLAEFFAHNALRTDPLPMPEPMPEPEPDPDPVDPEPMPDTEGEPADPGSSADTDGDAMPDPVGGTDTDVGSESASAVGSPQGCRVGRPRSTPVGLFGLWLLALAAGNRNVAERYGIVRMPDRRR